MSFIRLHKFSVLLITENQKDAIAVLKSFKWISVTKSEIKRSKAIPEPPAKTS